MSADLQTRRGVELAHTLDSPIDCFDTAIESGWYTVTMLASIMGAGNGKLYLTDEIIFDPPTGTGPGFPPSVNAYI